MVGEMVPTTVVAGLWWESGERRKGHEFDGGECSAW